MAASAYAALASITHVLEQLQHPARHQLRFDRSQIETLHEMVRFMLNFFEHHSTAVYDTDEEDVLRDMANCITEAEDVIEPHVVDQLSQRSADKADMGCLSFCDNIDRVIHKFMILNIVRAMANFITGADIVDSHVADQLRQRCAEKADMGYSSFCEDIDRVIQKFKTLKEEFSELREEKRSRQEQQPSVSLATIAGSSAPPAPFEINSMVGLDDHMARIKDRLIGGKFCLQTVPIVGMGGIGKTTLAKNIFNDLCFKNHFEICIWFTVSQEFRVPDILVGLLREVGEKESSGQKVSELGLKLHKKLFGRRYLIVLDDVWSTDVWYDLKLYFPDSCEGSRIIVTTRLSSIFDSLGKENSYSVDLLDDEKSWELLCQKAFGKVGCPDPKFEEIGRSIASDCNGLPLAIVVIGGLLSKSDVTLEKWEEVAKNVSSIVSSEDDELCLNKLSLSYNDLPVHLKLCFLYMRVYPEDYKVEVPQLIQSWIGEGFVISKGGQTLEEVAREYLKDLIDRNLIFINYQFDIKGNRKKKVGIHDLLRDLCIRENQRENTSRIAKVLVGELMQKPEDFEQRHICSLCGELICPHLNRLRSVEIIRPKEGPFLLVNTKLRYVDVRGDDYYFRSTWLHLFWNLRSLVFYSRDDGVIDLPSEIWKMPQLKHIKFFMAILPKPPVTPIDGKDSNSIVLESLETLGTLVDFSCSEEILARILNVKKLQIGFVEKGRDISYYEYHNLTHLHKLESLFISWECSRVPFSRVMKEFPRSLKKLTLKQCGFSWEDMTIIGSLPNLEVLKLHPDAFKGESWNPVEGEFLQLKKLSICNDDLTTWNAEKEHFPKLESLVFRWMESLKNFPSGIGEIDTLLSITLISCPNALVNSAKKVVAEQQTYGNVGLQLHVVKDWVALFKKIGEMQQIMPAE